MATTVPTTVDELLIELGCASPVFQPAERFATALVAEAVALGLVAEWEDSPIGASVLLSSLAQERLGLVLVDDLGEDEALSASRWVARSAERSPRSPVVGDAARIGNDLQGWESEGADPLERLIRAEAALAAAKRPTDDGASPSASTLGVLGRARLKLPPAPLVWLGSSSPGWSPYREPEKRPSDPRDCPTCKGLALDPITGCLSCLRTGVDSRLPKLDKHDLPAPEKKAAATAATSGDGPGDGGSKPPRAKSLAGGVGAPRPAPRSKAKARRKAG